MKTGIVGLVVLTVQGFQGGEWSMKILDGRVNSTPTVGGLFEAVVGAIETSLWRVWYDNTVAFYADGTTGGLPGDQAS